MLENLTMGSLLLYTGGALLVYYFVLVVVKGSGWLVKNRGTSGRPPIFGLGSSIPKAEATGHRNEATSDRALLLQTTVHDMVDEIQAFYGALDKNISKQEIVFSLKKLVAKYPAIKGTIYQEGINNLIAVSSQTDCGIHLTVDEVNELWE